MISFSQLVVSAKTSKETAELPVYGKFSGRDSVTVVVNDSNMPGTVHSRVADNPSRFRINSGPDKRPTGKRRAICPIIRRWRIVGQTKSAMIENGNRLSDRHGTIGDERIALPGRIRKRGKTGSTVTEGALLYA